MTPHVSYVSIQVAKDHLNAPQLTDEAIHTKVKIATGVIRDYLKRWADVRAVITSASVAAASVITTEAAHGFTTGQTVVISGVSGSVPDVNGERVLTVLTSTTFSIPVTVTVAGTGGTAIVEWDEETAPWPVQAATLVMLVHQHEHRGDDMEADETAWKAVERLLMRSRDPAFV